MRGRNPSADLAVGVAGGGSGRLLKRPFWPPGDKSRGFGGSGPQLSRLSRSNFIVFSPPAARTQLEADSPVPSGAVFRCTRVR